MLQVRNVTRAFDGVPVLRGIDLQVGQGEIVCLLGASGSGKTTLLRAVAGLELIDSGDVLVGGASIVDVPVHRRDFGLMFQDFALFPHMNVAENILFGLKMHGLPRAEQQHRLKEILELVALVGFEKRDVSQLSGGERQRVALGRSLAPNPRLLMLDEPLGSLDATLRQRLVVELRAIIKQVGLTTVYVTHDQQEAFAIADRVAIINAGVIDQIDTPETIYKLPLTAFVARFLGLNNVVPILRRDGDCVVTEVGDFEVRDDAEAVLLHPDGIQLAALDTTGTISGEVRERVFMGDSYRVTLQHHSGITLTFKLPATMKKALEIGETIAVEALPESVLPLLKRALA